MPSGRQRPARMVEAGRLRALIESLFVAAGCRSDHAAIMADVFSDADLRGHSTQGLDHIQSPLRDIRGGRIDTGAQPRIARERAATALIDGGGGLGPVTAMFAVDVAIRKARTAGSCVAGVIDASDVFMIGYYADRIARAGLVGLAFTTGTARVHAHGGSERVLGTNPVAIGIPTSERNPIVLDMSTSAIAAGRLRLAGYHGEEIPKGVALDPEGRPTRDARLAFTLPGAIHPFAGHKGFGLGLVIGLMSGPLVGAALGEALQGWGLGGGGIGPTGRRGHLFIAVDPAAFGDARAFRDAAGAYARTIRDSRKAPGVDAILMPGERSYRQRDRGFREGVAIYELVWQTTAGIAAELGVPMPS